DDSKSNRQPAMALVDGYSPSILACTRRSPPATDEDGQIRNEDVDGQVNASHGADAFHRPPDATDIVGCYVVDPERGRHDAPMVSPSAATDEN
ncbi:MAG: hypothetical protein P1U77_24765, partial [Rubripirellula sp.]|nr:hypothetical protein [Rubripirellula sp.]